MTFGVSSERKPTDNDPTKRAALLAEYLIREVRNYEHRNMYKYVGAGLSQEIYRLSPQIPARLWAELDIVPLVLKEEEGGSLVAGKNTEVALGVDEQADSMARKSLMYGFRTISQHHYIR